MGGAVANALSESGYKVSSWTRTPKELEGVISYHGQGELKQFVSQSNILVCLLPLTPTTRRILNAELFGWLPKGATIINVARGAHLVEEDLIQALNNGHLYGAILDVFQSEPLPEESQLWNHPKIRIFPHVSSMTNIDTSVQQIVNNRECILKCLPAPTDLVVDWNTGY